jgi:hypothetical protein
MLYELATAGPIFWGIVLFIALFIVGKVIETPRRRKLEMDLQKKLNRDLADEIES